MSKYFLQSQDQIDFKINYQSELNQEQLKAVTSGDGQSLVLAGAGSGKTRVLVYRVAYLLEKGVKPEQILLVTFTNKASKEMLSRIEQLLGSKPTGLWGGTFHHIGNRLLRMYGQTIGLDQNFNILDEEDAVSLLKTCLKQVNIPQDKFFPKPKVIKKVISLAVNLDCSVEQVLASRFAQIPETYSNIIVQIADTYAEKKRITKAVDFDDLLYLWNQLLLQSEGVRQKLQTKFRHILVDEYQDTNPIQGQIVKNLAGIKSNLLVVGDDCQSIYSFRGADVANILKFPETFINCQTYYLNTNYRSTPEILELANQSIVKNINQFNKQLQTDKASDQKPVVACATDASQQAAFVCQRILELSDQTGRSLSDMAVLFRAHYLSLELELELNKRNIPYVMRGGLRFFEQAHIKDVVAYLKILANCQDEVAWQRVLTLFDGVGPATVDKIWRQVSGSQQLEQILALDLSLPGKAAVSWYKVKQVLQRLLETDQAKLPTLLEIIVTAYDGYLKNNFDNYQDRQADLEQLIVFSGKYASLADFLADVALSEGFKGETVTGQSQGQDEAVTLSTIHQAKGLEWPVVFVIGLADGQFPNAKAFDKPSDLEEERRLFYVAVTRAQDDLYLVYPMFSKFGDTINQVSVFIKELPKHVYREWDIDEANGSNNLICGSTDDLPTIDVEEDLAADFMRKFRQRLSK